MTTTAGDLINSSLRLLGVLAEGESPSAEMSQDGLSALNMMLDSWSIERLSIFATREQTFTWPANQATRTLGPTGNLVGVRPVELHDSTYFKDSGVSFNVTLINAEQYNEIPVKTTTSAYPSVLWCNNTFPDSTLTLYPVPNRNLEFHFVSVSELTQVASLATDLAFPPGYHRAIKYGLAVEMGAEFGVEPSAHVARIAMTSKRALKRINSPKDVMVLPMSRVRFDIYAGSCR